MAVTKARGFARRLVWAVCTTHNEEDTIGDLVTACRTLGLGVVLVDEGSTDQTVDVAKNAMVDEIIYIDPQVHGKFGIGKCQRIGMRKALAWGATHIVTIDAGGSHDPREIPALVGALKDHDMAIGSRFCVGGNYVKGGGPWWRPVGSRVVAGLMNATVRKARFSDWSSGFRSFRAPMADFLCRQTYIGINHAWQIESLARAHERGAKIAEVPITYIFTGSSFRAATVHDLVKVYLHVFSHVGGPQK